ncbi:MAG: DUF3048 domain-containing protein [bacterium]|nr:DUF3048 domain-containing protein [bacterium]
MGHKQRAAIWSATVAVVLAAGIVAWRDTNPQARHSAPEAVAPPEAPALPEAERVFIPGADGETPFLVVIENTPQARPQSGLAEACLVYALPTEARITRFLASYCGDTPTSIGPVRSARQYMLEIASDLGAILVHAGHSAEALASIRAQKFPVINEFWASGPFWRDPSRKMPHNLYTRLDRLRAELHKKPMNVRPVSVPYSMEVAPQLVLPDATPSDVVVLDYGPPYAVRYRYDAGRRRYLRDQDGRPHLDADGRQIAPASVLVAFVQWRDVMEQGAPSSKITLIGTGRLAIITEGRLVEGAWRRSKDRPLALQTAGGGPVVLPRGPVWIELFPVDRPFAASAGSPGAGPSSR